MSHKPQDLHHFWFQWHHNRVAS